jgi:hypothetical protein
MNLGEIIKFDDAKPGYGTIDLVNGVLFGGKFYVSITFREMTGYEEELLADTSKRPSERFNQMLANCLVQAVCEDGSIWVGESLKEKTEFVLNMTIPDRAIYLIALRKVSVGDKYRFEAACSSCGETSMFELNLNDLKVIPAVGDKKEREYEVEIEGKRYLFKIPIGKDEIAFSVDTSRREPFTRAIAMRVKSVDGKPVSFEFLKSLPLRVRNKIRRTYEDREGGIETEVEMVCPKCGAFSKMMLDITQREFFFPSET